MTVSDFRPFLIRALTVARTEIAALTALFVAAIGVMTFVEIADDMTEADGQAFDHQVLALLRPYADDPGRPWGPWWLKEAAADITSLGGISVLGLFALIVIVFLLSQRKWLSSVLLALGLIGGVMLSEGLKAVFERERPPQALQAVETINASFPSGHALLATVFYLSVAVMLTRAFPRQRFKIFVLGVGILMALLVGLTRIYLGAHWATDVFAGWAVGSAWAMVLWLVAYGIARWQKRHQAPLQDEPSPMEPETGDDPTKV
ncbi:MAG: phosphatase PAP2 family protein [Alphaproteobacteria bacterium]|jgi:undecaprenyl-diphosphatase|uniref:Lipid A 1-diphosphate synthase n=1 Tax=Brevundimonas mediterranea TaxID=74329 RepID=A0A7Z8Y3F4_9CAUL|nr:MULTISPECIES: phosphatase PAP2 family protein [Brevundimonas]MBU1272853.1 phosphatase PAP2 family protein [Alphaproteobacteria bacterium]OGN46206.1 MAG: phosphoesterase [Caulobacterales bacterium GWE1_67_11]OGN47976.1 MAG: phosphoesterase [Caulobacterales bacterium RIFCSPHIGHO2_12_FULL_68_13]OGN49584.1 MAG: phosphoesterase [Caulobacterales bacterium RIFCSPHIGHO2_01_FULL_67_30]OGN49597.1 MAG: phosphoesterase [Caulobacterales bacterium RIFOXYA1_FULL_67_7]